MLGKLDLLVQDDLTVCSLHHLLLFNTDVRSKNETAAWFLSLCKPFFPAAVHIVCIFLCSYFCVYESLNLAIMDDPEFYHSHMIL